MPVKETIKVWIKRVCMGVGAFLFATTVFASVILLTPAGTSLARWLGNSYVDGLNIQTSKGALLLDPQFQQVSFKGAGIDFTAQHIGLALSPLDLFKKEVRIEALELNDAKIIYQESRSTPKKESQPVATNESKKIELPIDVVVNNIALDNIYLQVLGNKISWKSFSSALALKKNALIIKPTKWQQLSVYLAKREQEQTQEEKKTALKLPQVVLPLDINLQDFNLSQFALYAHNAEKPQLEFNQLDLKLQGIKSDLDIKYLNLVTPQIEFNSKANIRFDGNYPLRLVLNGKIKQQEFKGHKVNLNINGDLEKLHTEFELQGAQQAKLDSTLNLLNPKLPFSAQLTCKQLGYPIQTLADYKIENAELNAKGSLEDYQLHFFANTQGKQAPHVSVELEGNGAIKDSGDWLMAVNQLNIEGDYRELPLDIKGRFNASSTDQKIRLRTQGLNIAHGSNKVTLSGIIDKQYNLNLNIDVPQLKKSLSLAQGKIKGDIAITGDLKAPKLHLDLKAKNIAYQGNNTLEELLIYGKVSATKKDNQSPPFISGDLTFSANKAHILNADVDVDSVLMTLKGDQKKHQLRIDLQGKPIGMQLLVSGGLNNALDWNGALVSGVILTSQGDWQLAQGTNIEYLLKQRTLGIDSHCWEEQQSQICLAESLSLTPEKSGRAKLAINKLSLHMLQAFLPPTTQVVGELNSDINAQWNAKFEPNLEAKIAISQGYVTQEFAQLVKVEWDKIAFSTQLKNRKLDSHLEVDLTNNGDINTDISINDIRAKQRKMQGTMQITPLDIAFLAPVIGENIVLNGVLDSQLSIAGTVKQPEFSGELQLNEYQLKGDSAPIHINTGQMHVSLNKYQGKLDGRLRTQEGELLLAGDANWQDLNAWSTHFNIKGEKLKITPKSGMSILLSHDLTLSASATDAEITGKIVIPWARIKIREVPKGAISITDDQQILDSDLQVVKQDKAPPLNIRTDISVEIDKNVKLQAYGLSSFLQGNLHITQVDKRPNIDGDINLIHGTYQAFGQDLEITKGAILFTGPASHPYIDVTAIRNPETIEDNVTAGIKVIGPTSDLEVNIFSNPSMEQANALSYILSGRALGSNGGDSGMTSALIGLGLAQSGEFIGGIGNALGVQDLSLDTEGDGDDTAVAVSGYITPDLQLKYGVGLFSPMGEFTLKYRLMKKFYVQAVTGMDNAADLLYQFSFD